MDKKDENQTSANREQLVSRALDQHGEQIQQIIATTSVAVVVYERGPGNLYPLDTMGWDGDASVFPLSPLGRRKMVNLCEKAGDMVMIRWLCKNSTPRMLLMMHQDRLLINLSTEGWSFEPGSLNCAEA